MELFRENKLLVGILVTGMLLIVGVHFLTEKQVDGAAEVSVGIGENGEGVVGASQPQMPKGYQPEKVVRNPFLGPAKVQSVSPIQKISEPKNVKAPNKLSKASKSRAKEIKPCLLGTASSELAQAAIVQYGAETRTLRIHDSIGGYRLLEIGERTAVLEGPGGIITLRQEGGAG